MQNRDQGQQIRQEKLTNSVQEHNVDNVAPAQWVAVSLCGGTPPPRVECVVTTFSKQAKTLIHQQHRKLTTPFTSSYAQPCRTRGSPTMVASLTTWTDRVCCLWSKTRNKKTMTMTRQGFTKGTKTRIDTKTNKAIQRQRQDKTKTRDKRQRQRRTKTRTRQ